MIRNEWRKDAEYVQIVEDLLSHEDVQRLSTFVHHKVTNRLAHCLGVSYTSYRIAKRFNLDARAAARAALLHDLFFYKSSQKHLVGGRGHNYEHPRIALRNALKITELSDREQDIILKHMCGATFDMPKYIEGWIVTMMDKYCAIAERTVGTGTWLKFIYNQWQTITGNMVASYLNKGEMIPAPVAAYAFQRD